MTGVLEGHLAAEKAKGGEGWLVGNKLSYVDISFISWQQIILLLKPGAWDGEEFPNVKEWQDKLISRPIIKKILFEGRQAH